MSLPQSNETLQDENVDNFQYDRLLHVLHNMHNYLIKHIIPRPIIFSLVEMDILSRYEEGLLYKWVQTPSEGGELLISLILRKDFESVMAFVKSIEMDKSMNYIYVKLRKLYYSDDEFSFSWSLPSLPESYIRRAKLAKTVMAAIVNLNRPGIVALVGIPGCGKSTLALACLNDSIQRRIFYIDASIIRSQENILRSLLKEMKGDSPNYFDATTETLSRDIKYAINMEIPNSLLFLDNVKSQSVLDYFKFFKYILLTTHKADLIFWGDVQKVNVSDNFNAEESKKLFEKKFSVIPQYHLAIHCEARGFPLLMHNAVSFLAEQRCTDKSMFHWEEILLSLRQHKLCLNMEIYSALRGKLFLAFDDLETIHYYKMLVIFPDICPFKISALCHLWDMSNWQAELMIQQFVSSSLLVPHPSGIGYLLPLVLKDCLIYYNEKDSLEKMQIDFAKKAITHFQEKEFDSVGSYMNENTVYHFCKAGHNKEAAMLLANSEWMLNFCKEFGLSPFLRDYLRCKELIDELQEKRIHNFIKIFLVVSDPSHFLLQNESGKLDIFSAREKESLKLFAPECEDVPLHCTSLHAAWFCDRNSDYLLQWFTDECLIVHTYTGEVYARIPRVPSPKIVGSVCFDTGCIFTCRGPSVVCWRPYLRPSPKVPNEHDFALQDHDLFPLFEYSLPQNELVTVCKVVDNFLIVGGDNGTLSLFRTLDGECLDTYLRRKKPPIVRSILCASLVNNPEIFIFCGSVDGSVHFWNFKCQRLNYLASMFPHGETPVCHLEAYVTQDFYVNVVSSREECGNILVWNMSESGSIFGSLESSCPGACGLVNCIAVSHSKLYAAVAFSGGSVSVWDLGTLRLLYEFPHAGPVLSSYFSYDSSKLVTCEANACRVWSVDINVEDIPDNMCRISNLCVSESKIVILDMYFNMRILDSVRNMTWNDNCLQLPLHKYTCLDFNSRRNLVLLGTDSGLILVVFAAFSQFSLLERSHGVIKCTIKSLRIFNNFLEKETCISFTSFDESGFLKVWNVDVRKRNVTRLWEMSVSAFFLCRNDLIFCDSSSNMKILSSNLEVETLCETELSSVSLLSASDYHSYVILGQSNNIEVHGDGMREMFDAIGDVREVCINQDGSRFAFVDAFNLYIGILPDNLNNRILGKVSLTQPDIPLPMNARIHFSRSLSFVFICTKVIMYFHIDNAKAILSRVFFVSPRDVQYIASSDKLYLLDDFGSISWIDTKEIMI